MLPSGSTVYLISCVSKKREQACAASDMYLFDLFRKAKPYAEALGYSWFILSAEDGLVSPDRGGRALRADARSIPRNARDSVRQDPSQRPSGRHVLRRPTNSHVAGSRTSMGLFVGFLPGIVAAAIAAISASVPCAPLLKTFARLPRSPSQAPGQPPHEFFHVSVKNVATWWPLAGRRPAWSCTAALEVFRPDCPSVIGGAIPARWTSQPEPLSPVASGNQMGNVIDFARMMLARKVDIHSHEDQHIGLILKFEGDPDCYMFINESYLYPRWQNPNWRLPPGTYRVRVSVYYERGRAQDDFELRNDGVRRDDVHLHAWPGA